MKRGEVYWVNFDPQIGSEIKKRRPAVIIGNDLINDLRRTVLVIPLTKAHDQTEWPVLVAVKSTGPGCAVIDQLKACDKRRFGQKLGEVSAKEMEEIDQALVYVLALS